MSLNICSVVDKSANVSSAVVRRNSRISSIPKKFEEFEVFDKLKKIQGETFSLPLFNEVNKRSRSSSNESCVELNKKRKITEVISRGFNIETSVTYTRSMNIDPSCQEALAEAWKVHVNKEGISLGFTKEEKKIIACIETVADDGSDLYAQKYEIKKSEIPGAGNGLFARADGKGYKKNDIIDLYGGRLMLAKDIQDREYVFEWPDTPFAAFALDGKTEGNALRFMNHASPEKANVSSAEFFYKEKPYIIFIADKRILPGAEMCYDYGPEYWAQKGIVLK